MTTLNYQSQTFVTKGQAETVKLLLVNCCNQTENLNTFLGHYLLGTYLVEKPVFLHADSIRRLLLKNGL